MPNVLGADRADNCFRMTIVGSCSESGAWNNSSTQRIACSLRSWSASCRGKRFLWGNMELAMALKAGTSLSAVRPQFCSCMGATAVRADKFVVNLHLFPQSLGMSLEPHAGQCCGQVSFAKWTKTEKEEDTIQLLGTLLRKLSTRIGHKKISLGLESAEVMAWNACVTPWPSQERFYLQKCRYWYSEWKESASKSSYLKALAYWKFWWRCSHSFTDACLKAVLSPFLQHCEVCLQQMSPSIKRPARVQQSVSPL